jgi:DNA-binding MarR family transcriptional regulator
MADIFKEGSENAFFLSGKENYDPVTMPRMTPRLLHDDYDALASFRYAMRKFLSFSKRALAVEAGLTPEQYEALLALKAFPAATGLTIGQLSERLQVKHHTTVSLVDKLAGLSLVRRESGVADRRHVYVTLTAKGKRVLEKVAVLHREEMRARSPEMIEALLRLQK